MKNEIRNKIENNDQNLNFTRQYNINICMYAVGEHRDGWCKTEICLPSDDVMTPHEYFHCHVRFRLNSLFHAFPPVTLSLSTYQLWAALVHCEATCSSAIYSQTEELIF